MVGAGEHHKREWEIAEAGMTLLKNENNALPINGDQSALILYPDDAKKPAVDYAVGRLQREQLHDPSSVTAMCYADLAADNDDLLKAVESVDKVVVMSQSVSRNEEIAKVIARAREDGKSVVLLSLGLPYDAALYEEADAILCAYQPRGSAHDEEGNGPFNLNVAVALCTAFGRSVPSGTLPVNVPGISADEGEIVFTEDLLYERGYGLVNWGEESQQ